MAKLSEPMKQIICNYNAKLITSPAYDVGLKRDELMKTNFDKLSKLT